MQIDRKVWSGGLAGLAGAALVWAARKFLGLELDADTGTFLVASAAAAVAYLVPPRAQDVLRHLDDDARKIAGIGAAPVVAIMILGTACSACTSSPQPGAPSSLASTYASACTALAAAAPLASLVTTTLDPAVQVDVRAGLDALAALCPPPADPTRIEQDLPRVIAAVGRLAPLLVRAPEVAGPAGAGAKP